jgi:hypothetical protein
VKGGNYKTTVYLPKEDIYFENIKLIKYRSLKNISAKSFEDKISRIIDQEKFNNFWAWRKEYTTGKITAEEFFRKLKEIFGKKSIFKYFPYFIATIQNEETQKELDAVLLTEIRKLPKQKENLLTKSLKYSDLVNNFVKLVEDNIMSRIKNNMIGLKNRKFMDKSRIFQLIEIIRRVKTNEMVKFKFLTNFGVSLKNFDAITKKILFVNLEEIPAILETFPNEDLLPLFLYLTFCCDLLAGKKIHKEKSGRIEKLSSERSRKLII